MILRLSSKWAVRSGEGDGVRSLSVEERAPSRGLGRSRAEGSGRLLDGRRVRGAWTGDMGPAARGNEAAARAEKPVEMLHEPLDDRGRREDRQPMRRKQDHVFGGRARARFLAQDRLRRAGRRRYPRLRGNRVGCRRQVQNVTSGRLR